MLKGLRKRPSYDELINEIDKPFINAYPNRKASEIENSVYMSQLRSGFEEVIEQNNRVMKEKTKDVLLQEAASSGDISHVSLKASSGDISHVSLKASSYSSIDSSLQSLTSSRLRHYPRPAFSPRNQTEAFEIHSPRSEHSAESTTSAQREFIEQLFGPPIDHEALMQAVERIKEEQQQVERYKAKQTEVITQLRQNQGVTTSVDRLIHTPTIEVAASSSTSVPVRVRIEDIENRTNKPQEIQPQPKKQTAPKKFAKPNPEEETEPEQTKPTKVYPKKEKTTEKPTKTEKIEIKKTIKEKPKHNTEIEYLTLEELEKKGKGYLVDQIHKRPDIKFTKSDARKKTIKQMVDLIANSDKKTAHLIANSDKKFKRNIKV